MNRGHEQNVGPIDAYFRLLGGLTLLTFGATGRLGRIGSCLAVVLGASTVAEGVTRYSPMMDFFGVRSEAPRDSFEASEAVPRSFPWDDDEAKRSDKPRQAVTRRR